jgi:hypothetical protein
MAGAIRSPRSKKVGFWQGLKEIDMFFRGRDPVHKTMKRLTKRLEKAGIPYAIVGGMAVYAHRYRRTTYGLDVLLTRDGFAEFRRRFVPKSYSPTERPCRFVDKTSGITVDVLVTGLFPGSDKPGPVAYPDPANVTEEIEKVQVIDLPTLIQLKLAARRHQDFADVVNPISTHNLNESFVDKLHTSLRRDYIECLEEKRRDDEFNARED